MNLKIVITVCFLTLSATEAIRSKHKHVHPVKVTKSEDNLGDEVKDFFSKLGDSLLGIANCNIHFIYQLVKNIAKFFDNAFELGKALLENQGDYIQKCIFSKFVDIGNLVEKWFSDLVGCVTERVDAAVAIVKKAIHIATGTHHKIVHLIPRVTSCASTWSIFFCLPEIIYDAVSYALSIPGKIATSVGEAVSFVSTFEAKLGVCLASRTLTIGSKAGGVVVSSFRCIANKTLSG